MLIAVPAVSIAAFTSFKPLPVITAQTLSPFLMIPSAIARFTPATLAAPLGSPNTALNRAVLFIASMISASDTATISPRDSRQRMHALRQLRGVPQLMLSARVTPSTFTTSLSAWNASATGLHPAACTPACAAVS